LSSDALLLAAEQGSDVVVCDWREDPKARVVTGSLIGAALTKRAQLDAARSPRGLEVALGLAVAKCRNQANLLARLETSPTLARASARIRSQLRRVRLRLPAGDLDRARPATFALEGNCGRG